jgi:signal transduction histidine kinase
LKTSIEERDKSDALTKEVIGNISHDLKTPLTAIKGYSEGIMDGVAATPEQLDKYVSTIHTKAVDMAVLVDELSYFTKIYQRKENFNFQEVIVNRYFSECVAAMALDLETRDIQLLYRSDVSEDTIVTLDEEKIKRVINNIIGNAVKYIYHHHGMLLVQLSEDEEQVTVMIRDNGKGIEEEELPYIFDRFYRTDSSRNSKTGGSGLGLAIAKKIIDEHNGKIWAESEVDKGTAMYFSLPK